MNYKCFKLLKKRSILYLSYEFIYEKKYSKEMLYISRKNQDLNLRKITRGFITYQSTATVVISFVVPYEFLMSFLEPNIHWDSGRGYIRQLIMVVTDRA